MQTTQATPNGAGLVQHVTGTSPTHIIRHKHKRSRARNPPNYLPISPAPGPTTHTTPMDRGSLEQKAAAEILAPISSEQLVGINHFGSAAAESPHINHRGHRATSAAMKCPNGDYKIDEP